MLAALLPMMVASMPGLGQSAPPPGSPVREQRRIHTPMGVPLSELATVATPGERFRLPAGYLNSWLYPMSSEGVIKRDRLLAQNIGLSISDIEHEIEALAKDREPKPVPSDVLRRWFPYSDFDQNVSVLRLLGFRVETSVANDPAEASLGTVRKAAGVKQIEIQRLETDDDFGGKRRYARIYWLGITVTLRSDGQISVAGHFVADVAG